VRHGTETFALAGILDAKLKSAFSSGPNRAAWRPILNLIRTREFALKRKNRDWYQMINDERVCLARQLFPDSQLLTGLPVGVKY
jgi:hypothetical protein